MSAAEWLGCLQDLALRFSVACIGPDVAGLTLAQAWGVFLFLQRMAAGGADVG